MTKWLDDARKRVEEAGTEAIAPRLFVYKEGELEAFFLLGNPRLLANLAKIAIAGFEGDELVFVSDSYYSTQNTNPEGQKWEHGEMERRYREPAVAAIVRESLIMFQVKPDQPTQFVQQPYERKDGKFIWLEPDMTVETEGVLPEALRDAINARPILDAGAGLLGTTRAKLEEVTGLPPDVIRLHTRLAAVKFMAGIAVNAGENIGVAFPTNSAEEARAAERSLGDIPGLEVEWFHPGPQA